MSRVVILLAVTCCALLACADGECVPMEGKEYNWNAVSEVTQGMSSEQLRSKVGEPVTIARVSPDVQDWRFYYRCKRTSWVMLGGVRIKSGGATIRSEAVIRVKSGRVERVVNNGGWVSE